MLDLSDLDEEGPVHAEWAAVVRERGAELLRFAFQLTHDRARSQDLLQDSIVRVLSSRQNTTVDHPEAYLRKTIVNCFLNSERDRAARERTQSRAGEQEGFVGHEDQDRVVEKLALWDLLGSCRPGNARSWFFGTIAVCRTQKSAQR